MATRSTSHNKNQKRCNYFGATMP